MSDAPFYCPVALCWCDRIECNFDPLTGKGCSMKRLKRKRNEKKDTNNNY